jgi:hypothetical protein
MAHVAELTTLACCLVLILWVIGPGYTRYVSAREQRPAKPAKPALSVTELLMLTELHRDAHARGMLRLPSCRELQCTRDEIR